MLTPEDLALLESSLLPARERHYLRLLAHGLRTFQAVAATSADPQRWPDGPQLEAWCASQASLADDPAFRGAFLEQLSRLEEALLQMARQHGQPPLTLEMDHLLAWARERADERLRSPTPPPS